ncbi:ABC transporter ATP-binding protein [Pseudonocardia sp. HH130630-07]|uniref:ABC transporter ATP-binding protein n=1 Tax=Pseudonocardia sp. HH130630-07 TaxID=1690815 RepID=UPI000B0C2D9A|nr:ABC transporter ATP-binding protein [Pseudonocardia sp. HH130630-07]
MPDPVLELRGLRVDFRGTGGGWEETTHGVDLTLHAGETVALVGESGSGKSVTAMAVLGLLPATARRRGSALFDGTDLVAATDATLRRIRGRRIAMVFQEPMTALNPVWTIGNQIGRAVRTHDRTLSRAQVRERVLELLCRVHMPDPGRRIDSYPHQLSGGQRQRAMIAMAISCDPEVLIADEPTTALDVTVQAEILDLLAELRDRLSMALLVITHDMGVVAEVADRVVVMRDGAVVEQAPCTELFDAPVHAYTADLLAAVPHLGRGRIRTGPAGPQDGEVLRIDGMTVEYPGRGRRASFRAVADVDLAVSAGEVVGLVGESGSGKSTIGRAVVGLAPVTAGRVRLGDTDMAGARGAGLRAARREVAMVFQDPASSLDPRRTIGESITGPLAIHRAVPRGGLDARARELLDQVGIRGDWADRHPHELSGGQRQRVGIARALALSPRLVVADEPTSALDVSVQTRVLDLLRELQEQRGFACLFISHDLSVIELLAHRVVVLRDGRVVEQGRTADVLGARRRSTHAGSSRRPRCRTRGHSGGARRTGGPGRSRPAEPRGRRAHDGPGTMQRCPRPAPPPQGRAGVAR